MVVVGRLVDLLGCRWIFLFGVLVFIIVFGLCVVVGSVEQLVVFWVLQGIGVVIFVFVLFVLVVEGFDVVCCVYVIGLWGVVVVIVVGLGLLIGGFFVEWVGWWWVLLVNVLLGIVVVIVIKCMFVESCVLGWCCMFDLCGVLLFVVMFGLVIFGLVKGLDWGWLSVVIVGLFLVSVLILVGFVYSLWLYFVLLVELVLLCSWLFVVGNLFMWVVVVGFYCYGFIYVFYFNYVWYYLLLKVGFVIVFVVVVVVVVVVVLGWVVGWYGYCVIVFVGVLVWVGSLVWYLQCVGFELDFFCVWLLG